MAYFYRLPEQSEHHPIPEDFLAVSTERIKEYIRSKHGIEGAFKLRFYKGRKNMYAKNGTTLKESDVPEGTVLSVLYADTPRAQRDRREQAKETAALEAEQRPNRQCLEDDDAKAHVQEASALQKMMAENARLTHENAMLKHEKEEANQKCRKLTTVNEELRNGMNLAQCKAVKIFEEMQAEIDALKNPVKTASAPAKPEPTAVALGTAPPPAVRQASAPEEIEPVGVVSLPETTAAPQIPSRKAFLRMRSMQRPSGTTAAKRAQAPTGRKAAATTDDFYRGVRRNHCERPQLRVPRASEISV